MTGVRPLPLSPAAVERAFRDALRGGAELRPAGAARERPGALLRRPYLPRHAVELFGARFYLTDFLCEEGLDFLVAYVALPGARAVWPRIFYKDSSLVWRVASHVIRTNGEDWIGKGDVRWVEEGDLLHLESDEDTTNLPYELQPALDEVSRRARKLRDDDAVCLVLRNAPRGRLEPYADFARPRREAERRGALNGGRPVARIARDGDPGSLRFARGFEPDFGRGPVEAWRAGSRLYGGSLTKYRVLSSNGLVQYLLVGARRHAWINPPQALTRELTSYGVRALHVPADDRVFLPGYEYHYLVADGDGPPELHSQIPAGFAGRPSAVDPGRADASPWIERLPVIREFRRRVLRRAPRRSR